MMINNILFLQIMPHMPFMFTSLILIELRLSEKKQARVHRDMMASQDVPLDDQFHIAIENWDLKFQSHMEEKKKNVGIQMGSANFMSKFKKRQSTVAVINEHGGV